MSVTLSPSVASPAPLGTVVTWTADVAEAAPGTIWYRFRVRRTGEEARIVKDFGPANSFDWTASDYEGNFEIEADVRNLDAGQSTAASQFFQMLSRVTAGQPVISPTAHPLVFLYSAPPCPAGARMQVEFRDPEGAAQRTPYRNCLPGLSVNFYLAGLRPVTEYSARHMVEASSAVEQGPTLTLTTGDVPPDTLAAHAMVKGPPPVVIEGVLLEATLFTNPVATDIDGNLIWYYPDILSFLTRPAKNGHFFGILQTLGADPSYQALREFDLSGMTVRETNAARVSEQLVALGKRPIGAFHHEARQLPDGRILALGSVEQVLTDIQGPGPVDILGDMIVVMDSNLQVVWAWDAFDHLDVTRKATLDDRCIPGGGCPPLYLAATANDWLHGNAVELTPGGSLLYSARSQDWVVKIDYQNGDGGGDILWRLGKDGDFQFLSTDPYPWFSHQHDPQLLPDDGTLLVFDNGNLRIQDDPSANSRGQVIYLDEVDRTVRLLLNADLGSYSFALGSAQALANGDYHFENGFQSDTTGMALEVDPDGNIVYALRCTAPTYRSFRMLDLYTP